MEKIDLDETGIGWWLIFAGAVGFIIVFLGGNSLFSLSEQEPHFVIYKEECYLEESHYTDWYDVDEMDNFDLQWIGLKGDMGEEVKSRAYYFNGWDYLEYKLCWDLLDSEEINDVIGFSTCDNFVYENKYAPLYEDYVGCLKCAYNIDLKDGIKERKERQFEGITFKVPEFNHSEVYLYCIDEDWCRIKNRNIYWSAEFKLGLNPKEVCEDVEVDEIESNKEVCGNWTYYCYDRMYHQKEYPYDKFAEYSNLEERYCLIETEFNSTGCLKYDEEEITKENLTIEWLDENCDCAKASGDYVISKADCSQIESVSIEGLEEGECEEYQCGEYKVEMWEQIK